MNSWRKALCSTLHRELRSKLQKSHIRTNEALPAEETSQPETTASAASLNAAAQASADAKRYESSSFSVLVDSSSPDTLWRFFGSPESLRMILLLLRSVFSSAQVTERPRRHHRRLVQRRRELAAGRRRPTGAASRRRRRSSPPSIAAPPLLPSPVAAAQRRRASSRRRRASSCCFAFAGNERRRRPLHSGHPRRRVQRRCFAFVGRPPPSIAAPSVAAHRRRVAAPPLSPASVTVAASGRCPELISPAD
ncbi:unnamed protein product [Cuscuta campestris]|uniref:Uncharacterized protein n=1 Tax=Cuscuta campestris TaxID=132261 RepID=A0A484LL63_9ASTE|nr:unnamed protein product [Cuscuta campestris]